MERSGNGIGAAECLFVDDVLVNVEARGLGMTAVHFRDNEQAIAEIEAAVGGRRPRTRRTARRPGTVVGT